MRDPSHLSLSEPGPTPGFLFLPEAEHRPATWHDLSARGLDGLPRSDPLAICQPQDLGPSQIWASVSVHTDAKVRFRPNG